MRTGNRQHAQGGDLSGGIYKAIGVVPTATHEPEITPKAPPAIPTYGSLGDVVDLARLHVVDVAVHGDAWEGGGGEFKHMKASVLQTQ